MTNRNQAREGEAIDSKFSQLYKPLEEDLNALVFDLKTGRIDVPVHVEMKINDVNQHWNQLATMMNKKNKAARANFGAVKTKFHNEVQRKETKMFLIAVSRLIASKYKLTEKDIEAEYIANGKTEGLTPEQVCDKKFLEMPEMNTSFWKHRHEWMVVCDRKYMKWYVICKDCRRRFSNSYNTEEGAMIIAEALPQANWKYVLTKIKF